MGFVSGGQIGGTAPEFKFDLADAADSRSAGAAVESHVFHVEKFDSQKGLFLFPAEGGVKSADESCDTETPGSEDRSIEISARGKGADAVEKTGLVQLPHPVVFRGHEPERNIGQIGIFNIFPVKKIDPGLPAPGIHSGLAQIGKIKGTLFFRNDRKLKYAGFF